MAYPASLDNFNDPSATDTLASPSHSSLHQAVNEAVEQLEAKVGVTSSAVTTSHTYKLSGVTGSDLAVSKTGTETLTNKTLTSPTLTGPAINSSVSGSAVLDEDNMASDSSTKLATQQSIKAYSDTKIPLTYMDTDGTLAADSDSKIASQKATKTYVDTEIAVKTVGISVIGAGIDLGVGDAKAFFRVPELMNGWNLIACNATVYTAGTTGTTDIQIRNKTDSVDMLSTKMTIDSTETDTSTAATAAVIDTTKDDVATGDVLAIDIDAVSTTEPQGLYIELKFQKP